MSTQVSRPQPLGLSRNDGSLPELSRTAARGARQSQSWYFRLLRIELVAIVVAAIAQFVLHPFGQQIASLLHFHLGGVQIVGFTFTSVTITNAVAASLLSGLAVLVAIGAAALRFYLRLDEQWHARRSLAEAVIGLAWRYSMGAQPGDLAAGAQDMSHGNTEYSEAYQKLVDSADTMDLPPPPSSQKSITAKMSELRKDASPPQKRTAYLTDRLDDQITFYSDQAHRFHASRNRLRWAMIGCYVIGAVLLPFNGLAALTTAAGALSTWVAAKHYSDLVQSYSAMARKMQAQRTKATGLALDGSTAPGKWAQFVDSLETQLEGEHQDWVRQVAQQVG